MLAISAILERRLPLLGTCSALVVITVLLVPLPPLSVLMER